MVANKRFQIKRFDLETFGILENWSLSRGGRLREMIATGASTVLTLVALIAFQTRASPTPS